MSKNLSRRKMQGGGEDPNFFKKKFEVKIFFGNFFFGSKKLIQPHRGKSFRKYICYPTWY